MSEFKDKQDITHSCPPPLGVVWGSAFSIAYYVVVTMQCPLGVVWSAALSIAYYVVVTM